MTPEQRFNNQWTPEPNSGCWLWIGVSNGRYGQFYLNGSNILAHRASWTLSNGQIPNGSRVLHRCDTPLCVNPKHLFLGTQLQNLQDSIAKGRYNRPKGEQHHKSKLTESDVREIRLIPNSEAAKRFGISRSHAHRIRKRTYWKHI